MARNSVTGQSLKFEGFDALESYRYQEQRLKEFLLEIREYNPEATIEDARHRLHEYDQNCEAADYLYEDFDIPILGGWMSW